MPDVATDLAMAITNSDNASTADLVDKAMVDTVELGPENTLKFYSVWSDTYDKDFIDGRDDPSVYYKGTPTVISKNVLQVLDGNLEAKVLDVCGGTGILGAEMKSHGVCNVDILDGSSGMLEKAKEKGIYQNYIVEMITENKLQKIEDGSYDIVMASGCFLPGHLTGKHLRTVARTLRKGGFMVIAMRTLWIARPDLHGFDDVIAQLEKEKFWKVQKREPFDSYYHGHEGTAFIFQKL